MNYLLDTCIISELVKPKPYKKVTEWIKNSDEESLYLSVLTIGEIQKGISKLTDTRRKALLRHWLYNDLRKRFAGRIWPISEDVAIAWGSLQGTSEIQGLPIPTIDGLIGATALVHQCTIVTRNESDLKKTGALIFNPWN
ncbi:MAG TPA: VapC toxin family PIN domain ribonuclease [Fibrobacteres bacterium]|nr:VapC toxin family PIN domain ribonuclease [Fibrobacterota bacterium]